MPITDTAPYGTAAAVIKIMETYRETGLGGSAITVELGTRMSMGPEVARRAVLSLRLLELIDDEGNPTQNFVAFKQAASSDYKQVFANLLYDVYSPIFAVLGKDPSLKTSVEIEDAFRAFKQDSLRDRMVSCFLGLCEYTGIITNAPTRPSVPKPKVRKESTSRPPARRQDPPPPPLPSHEAALSAGPSASATLASGGTVTLTVSVNVVDLSPSDRTFVFDLIDKVKAYGERPALPVGGVEEVLTP